eukprot:403337292
MHQFPFIIGFFVQGIVFLINWSNQPLDIIGLVLCSVSTLLLILYGEVNFNRLKVFGPYQVGFKEFRTKKFGNAVSVYYPMCKDLYKSKIGRHNTPWLRNGDRTLLGIAKASGEYGSDKHASVNIIRHLRKVMLDVVMNGDIHPDFHVKPIIPLVYCHGLSSNRTLHSGTCKDLASHGYMVFILDHKDGTSSYVVEEDGTETFYDSKHLAYDYELRRAQIVQREKEVIALVDEIQDQEDMINNTLKLNSHVKLQFDKLIMSGHSFGGITAISVTRLDERVKLLFTLDPWTFAYHKEILAGEFQLNVPFFTVSTEEFHPVCKYDSWTCLENLFAHSKNNVKENVIYRKCGHLNQCDMAALIPLELYILAKWLPRVDSNQIYQGQSKVVLSFLSKAGFNNNTYNHANIEKMIQNIERQWIKYDIKYNANELKQYTPPEIEFTSQNFK